MSQLFFYGTLCHIPLLERVLDRAAEEIDMSQASLADHAVYQVRENNFPMIQCEPGAAAAGILVRGLSPEDVASLNFYEGGFEYDLQIQQVDLPNGDMAAAEVYFPRPGLWEASVPWDLARWAEEWGDIVTRGAVEIMAYHGRFSALDVAGRTTPIQIRANAWVAAQKKPADPKRDLETDVIVHRHHHAHLNFFSTEEADLQYRKYDGSMSAVITRSALMVGAASVVLPYDPHRDEVLLIEQFRAPPFMAGDRHPWMWEPVAGLIDPGETPEQAAHREAAEEAGITIQRLEPVAQVYSSSGASGEFVHIFIGLSDLSNCGEGGGVISEGEDIRSQVISFDALMQGIDNQIYQDMPLVSAALWLARHRDRLQRDANGAS